MGGLKNDWLEPATNVFNDHLPQAVPLMLPPLTGILVNLIKHSAILSFVAVFELTTEARNLIADTFMSFEIWMIVGVFTMTISYPRLSAILNVVCGILNRCIVHIKN